MSKESSPNRLNLEQQRKRAKDLLRAVRDGAADPQLAAATRFAAHLPRLSGATPAQGVEANTTLSEAQFVVAREAGYPSWPRMKLALEGAAESREERVAALIEAAVQGEDARARALLENDPDLPSFSIHAACAMGEKEAALALLSKRPDLASSEGGPYGWTPLLYLTCSAIAAKCSDAESRVAIATRLLELGADPTEVTKDSRLVQGERTTLSGAIVYVRSAELLRLLLDAGGAATRRLKNTAMLAHAVEVDDDLRCVELILPLKPPSWELRGALATAIDRHDARAVNRLLTAGADPNASGVWGNAGSSLHHAIVSGCSREILVALLDRGADPLATDRDARTPLQIALRTDHPSAVGLLKERGVTSIEDDVDRALAAALRGEEKTLDELLHDHSEIASRFARTDHQLLSWAIRRGRLDAIPHLLRIGLDPNVCDDEGALPLGLAAARGDLGLVRRLIGAGATVDAADLDGRTSLEHALRIDDDLRRGELVQELVGRGADPARIHEIPRVADVLDRDLRKRGAVERSDLAEMFERAAVAIVDGEVDELLRLLRDEPNLIRARSPRNHRCTLLHYVGANGIEEHRQRTPANGVEVLQLLIDHGAEPDALARTYGGGPAQTTLGLLVSSSHPADAGIQGDLVRRLVVGGANPDGLDGDGMPMATAIAFRCGQAVAALAETASLGNAIFAGAAGRLDLLERDVDLSGRLRDGSGHCAVPWLHMSRDPVVVPQQALIAAAQFGHLDAVKFLVARGVDPTAAPVSKITAMHEAAYQGELEVVRYLIAQGADPGARDALFRSSSIGWADEGKHQDVIDLILETHEPDLYDSVDRNLLEPARRHLTRDPSLVNVPEGRGNLLRWAAVQDMREMVALLLEFGADRTLANEKGETAIDLARAKGLTEMVKVLELH